MKGVREERIWIKGEETWVEEEGGQVWQSGL